MENLKKNRNGLLNDLNNKKINLSDVVITNDRKYAF